MNYCIPIDEIILFRRRPRRQPIQALQNSTRIASKGEYETRTMSITRIARKRQTRRIVASIFFATVLLSALFATVLVEGFITVSRHEPYARLPAHCLRASSDDVDVVGEGRRGDAKGAALRLVDVAVSRGGSTLLSYIDWRVEPKSKWALVVRIVLYPIVSTLSRADTVLNSYAVGII